MDIRSGPKNEIFPLGDLFAGQTASWHGPVTGTTSMVFDRNSCAMLGIIARSQATNLVGGQFISLWSFILAIVEFDVIGRCSNSLIISWLAHLCDWKTVSRARRCSPCVPSCIPISQGPSNQEPMLGLRQEQRSQSGSLYPLLFCQYGLALSFVLSNLCGGSMNHRWHLLLAPSL